MECSAFDMDFICINLKLIVLFNSNIMKGGGKSAFGIEKNAD